MPPSFYRVAEFQERTGRFAPVQFAADGRGLLGRLGSADLFAPKREHGNDRQENGSESVCHLLVPPVQAMFWYGISERSSQMCWDRMQKRIRRKGIRQIPSRHFEDARDCAIRRLVISSQARFQQTGAFSQIALTGSGHVAVPVVLLMLIA